MEGRDAGTVVQGEICVLGKRCGRLWSGRGFWRLFAKESGDGVGGEKERRETRIDRGISDPLVFRVVADSIHFLIPLSLSSQTGLFLSILDWKCQIREFEEKPRDNWTRRYWSELQSSSSKTKHDKKMSNATSRDHVTRKNYLIDVFFFFVGEICGCWWKSSIYRKWKGSSEWNKAAARQIVQLELYTGCFQSARSEQI